MSSTELAEMMRNVQRPQDVGHDVTHVLDTPLHTQCMEILLFSGTDKNGGRQNRSTYG